MEKQSPGSIIIRNWKRLKRGVIGLSRFEVWHSNSKCPQSFRLLKNIEIINNNGVFEATLPPETKRYIRVVMIDNI